MNNPSNPNNMNFPDNPNYQNNQNAPDYYGGSNNMNNYSVNPEYNVPVKKKSSKNAVIAAAAIFAIAVLVVGLLFALGVFSKSKGCETPRQAIESFLKCSSKKDIDGMIDLCSDNFLKLCAQENNCSVSGLKDVFETYFLASWGSDSHDFDSSDYKEVSDYDKIKSLKDVLNLIGIKFDDVKIYSAEEILNNGVVYSSLSVLCYDNKWYIDPMFAYCATVNIKDEIYKNDEKSAVSKDLSSLDNVYVAVRTAICFEKVYEDVLADGQWRALDSLVSSGEPITSGENAELAKELFGPEGTLGIKYTIEAGKIGSAFISKAAGNGKVCYKISPDYRVTVGIGYLDGTTFTPADEIKIPNIGEY